MLRKVRLMVVHAMAVVLAQAVALDAARAVAIQLALAVVSSMAAKVSTRLKCVIYFMGIAHAHEVFKDSC